MSSAPHPCRLGRGPQLCARPDGLLHRDAGPVGRQLVEHHQQHEHSDLHERLGRRRARPPRPCAEAQTERRGARPVRRTSPSSRPRAGPRPPTGRAASPGIDLVLLSSRKVGGFSQQPRRHRRSSRRRSAPRRPSSHKGQRADGRGRVAPSPRHADKDRWRVSHRHGASQTAFEQRGVKVVARSYGLTHGGRIYLLTLSSSQQDAEPRDGRARRDPRVVDVVVSTHPSASER